jgi:hypothetical protein
MSTRVPQRTPWLHAPSGFWCAQIAGKRRYLDRDPLVAQRKLRQLLQELRRGDGTHREWLSSYFSDLADAFLDDVKTRKHPATFRSYREMLELAKVEASGNSSLAMAPTPPASKDRWCSRLAR